MKKLQQETKQVFTATNKIWKSVTMLWSAKTNRYFQAFMQKWHLLTKVVAATRCGKSLKLFMGQVEGTRLWTDG